MTQMKELQVTIDIDILRAPCELADIFYVGVQNKPHSIQKYHLYPNGTKEISQGSRDLNHLVQAAREGHGCQLAGSFYKHFLVSHFVVNYGNPAQMAFLANEFPTFKLDLSHRINSLYLGEMKDHETLEQTYKIKGFNQLAGTNQVEKDRQIGSRIRHTYWVKVCR